MYGYAGNSAAASTLTAFTAPPSTTNPAGVATQAAAVTQAAGTSTGAGVQSTLSQLTSAVPTALQSLASPAASSTSLTSVLSGHRECASGGSSSGTTGPLATFSDGFRRVVRFLARRHPDRSGYRLRCISQGFGHIFGERRDRARDGYADIGSPKQWLQPKLPRVQRPHPWPGRGGGGRPGALGSGFAGGAGGFAGLGQAASVGTLSVPQGWGWAATPQAAMMGGVPLASALPGVNLGRDKWATTSGWATR